MARRYSQVPHPLQPLHSHSCAVHLCCPHCGLLRPVAALRAATTMSAAAALLLLYCCSTAVALLLLHTAEKSCLLTSKKTMRASKRQCPHAAHVQIITKRAIARATIGGIISLQQHQTLRNLGLLCRRRPLMLGFRRFGLPFWLFWRNCLNWWLGTFRRNNLHRLWPL